MIWYFLFAIYLVVGFAQSQRALKHEREAKVKVGKFVMCLILFYCVIWPYYTPYFLIKDRFSKRK